MKKIMTSIALTLCTLCAVAQQTIPVSGGSVTSAVGGFSFTLGQVFAMSDFEPAVSANIVTASVIEGVQQPFTIDQLSIEETTPLEGRVIIYPNPTKGHVIIELENGMDNVEYRLYGIEGRLFQRGVIQHRISLELSDYPSGTYLLYLGNVQQKNIYRIIKVN